MVAWISFYFCVYSKINFLNKKSYLKLKYNSNVIIHYLIIPEYVSGTWQGGAHAVLARESRADAHPGCPCVSGNFCPD